MRAFVLGFLGVALASSSCLAADPVRKSHREICDNDGLYPCLGEASKYYYQCRDECYYKYGKAGNAYNQCDRYCAGTSDNYRDACYTRYCTVDSLKKGKH